MRYTLIVFSSFLLFGCHSENSEYFADNDQLLESADSFTHLDSLALAVENTFIPSETILQNIKNKENVPLNELDLNNSLVLYISELQCSTCIGQELELLKTRYNASQVTLLCNYRSLRDLKLYLLINKIEFPAYMIRSEMPELIRGLTNPTYFRLGSNYRPSSVFFASFTARKKSEAFHNNMSGFLAQY